MTSTRALTALLAVTCAVAIPTTFSSPATVHPLVNAHHNYSRLFVVNITHAQITTQIAVQVCAGLYNSPPYSTHHDNPAAYTLMSESDIDWLTRLNVTDSPPDPTPIPTFLAACLHDDGPAAGRRIRYNYTAQKAVAPNLLTLSGMLRAVPLEDDDPASKSTKTVFDALKEWGANYPALNATEYMFDRYANATSAMAMVEPGFDAHDHPIRPSITGQLNAHLVDYVVAAPLFAFFLYDGCVAGSAEHELLLRMVNEGPWDKPIAVWGYNDAFPVAGDLFEAETLCTHAHNMGQIASDGVNNFAFFARDPCITSPLPQSPPVHGKYSSNTTYLSVLVGDGDNTAYLFGTRSQWMAERLAYCRSRPASQCFPLVWTLSPHIVNVAPRLTRWYFAQANSTGSDYFVLPPSGYLYAYPASMPPDVQANFVSRTAEAARMYSTDGTVDWEWFTEWSKTEAVYNRYAAEGRVRGIFPVNVPYLFPLPELFPPGVYTRIYGNRTVLFRPREWRGISGHEDIPFVRRMYFTPEKLAEEINNYPRGTAAAIYVTSDGGANMTDIFALAENLASHVKFVDHSTLVDMALAAAGIHE